MQLSGLGHVIEYRCLLTNASIQKVSAAPKYLFMAIRRCAAVLLYKSDFLGPTQAALATYSLGMLGLRDQAGCGMSWVQSTTLEFWLQFCDGCTNRVSRVLSPPVNPGTFPSIQALCDMLEATTSSRLSQLPTDSLAAVLTGFGALGHRPAEEWMGQFFLESFTR